MHQQLENNFAELLEQHQNIVHKICRIYTNNVHTHQDLFQEIVIQLWKSYPNFKGESKFSTWAYRVALNTAISLFRKKKRDIAYTSYDVMPFQVAVQEYNDEEEVQLKMMYKAIHQLNDIDKALIFLYLEDREYAEIAETLGISEVNVRVKLNRVKTRLKNLINYGG